ncbi:methyltransferase domain-containing protein [Pseudomonas sp. NPDC008258]|uniref:class I SAM-dependent methyltransferase n=1 Tax=Pseudomonas sp. NPDC008258 TaxID=3364418 RepID=UPI0036EF868A
MNAGFYRAFEDRYRGSRELITQRLEAYLPFLQPLKTLYADCPVFDIGCGRGEWLELMKREGFTPMGVDLDEGMLEACRAAGLPAQKADALQALRGLADNSQVVVSGFHIAEHVPFSVLGELVSEALRVLRPAGLLILETPNAENVMVGTNNFYLDPTHDQPIPNLLMSFLTEHTGFVRSKVVRLQEAAALHDEQARVGVREVLSGASPDYAVVAQKQAGAQQLANFEAVFEASYGLSLDDIALRYDQGIESRFGNLENSVEEVRATFFEPAEFQRLMAEVSQQQTQQLLAMKEHYEAAAEASNRQCGAMQEALSQALANAEAMTQERNAALDNCHWQHMRAQGAEQQIEAMRNSTSWRITGPLRVTGRVVLWPSRHGKAWLRKKLRLAAPHARLWVARRPAVRRLALAMLNRTPWLATKLRNLLAPDPASVAVDHQHGVIDHAPLTPRGRAIENALRAAMKKG